MSGHGFESNIWMAKIIVAQASPYYLRKAVIDVINWMSSMEDGDAFSTYGVLDRIVQISSTGTYTPPDVDLEEYMSDFVQSLSDTPEMEDKLTRDEIADRLRKLWNPEEDNNE